MEDSKWIAQIKKIKDPMKMLKVIVEHEHFLGFDPYYKDLRAAMLDQATKIVEENDGV